MRKLVLVYFSLVLFSCLVITGCRKSDPFFTLINSAKFSSAYLEDLGEFNTKKNKKLRLSLLVLKRHILTPDTRPTYTFLFKIKNSTHTSDPPLSVKKGNILEFCTAKMKIATISRADSTLEIRVYPHRQIVESIEYRVLSEEKFKKIELQDELTFTIQGEHDAVCCKLTREQRDSLKTQLSRVQNMLDYAETIQKITSE